ncbi:MAG: hypothetical protein DME26_19860 [Verrucomicrobia bacterium]|nr:MAG: hypothetical protein DME26_19860 [Verrucomicrobiota bacterium]
MFVNDANGGFTRSRGALPDVPLTRDQTTVLACPQTSGLPSVLVGSANYEDGLPTGASVLKCDPTAGTTQEAVPGVPESVGPLALGDLDGDGNLDLFVGGQVMPGKYPEAVNSRIFRHRDGKFALDTANTKLLENVGLVSGAKIFRNDHGRLVPWNPPVESINHQPSTLNQLTGWWNGITTGDLDGDGRLDIIASNWGQNSKYQSHRAAPLRLYFSDFNGEGVLELLEAYFEPGMGEYVPERRLEAVAEAMPFLRGRFSTHQAFANVGVEEILRDRVPKANYLEANCLESCVFLNRGDKLEARALPAEAQFAPAFAVVVADYDGDGYEDVFLSQNFFAEGPETSRCDAGRGLWLRGDGRGALRAVPGPESGVLVYGEQRGAAVADFDRDGRVDLIVTQNAAETRLFRNLRAKPGLRVRLKGPPGNPFGYGAQMRLKHGEHFGPVREVHGGGGYWSQDSPAQVLARTDSPVQVWIRWPGGKAFTVDVPPESAEVQIVIDGEITRVK